MHPMGQILRGLKRNTKIIVTAADPEGSMVREPSFDNPPITELALSVRFESLPGFNTSQFGLLWHEKYRGRFPKVEDQLGQEMPLESLDPPAPQVFSPLQLQEGPPPIRLWFLNAEGSELIQIQADMFARNWRRQGQEKWEYPRYTRMRSAFETDLGSFVEFLKDEGLGEFAPIQCGLTYVNHIEVEGLAESFGNLDKVLTLWRFPDVSGVPKPEFATLQTRSRFKDPSGNFVGQLYVSVAPGFRRKDDSPIIMLTLSARGKPRSAIMDGVLDFLDMSHEVIVEAFLALTTKEAQELWGRQNGD